MADQEPREGNNPDEERPDWLPENFKTPEELARSYSEASAKIREQGAQLNAMNENYQSLTQRLEEIQASSQTQPDPAQAQSQWQEMYEADPIGTQALLTQQVVRAELAQLQQGQQPSQEAQTQLIAVYAANEMRGRYGDWETERDRVSQEIAQNPLFNSEQLLANPATAVAAFDQAYAIVKGRDAINGVNTTPQQDGARAMKLSAQTVTGGGSRPDAPDAEAESWARIAGATGGSYADLHRPR